ncbi:MAG TPA: trigger factor [Anaerolineales bacterium]|nr:trigger factor [Anaerolineales bacterium]
MKFEKTLLEDHQAQVVVEIEPEQFEAAKRRAARKLAERGKIPGFRPGKAPFEVIRRYYSDEAIYDQAVDLMVDDVYPAMLKETEVNPAAAGTLEKLEKVEGQELPKFTFKIPLMPEVDLGDYQSVRLPYEFVAPSQEKLDQALDELRQMYGTTETVDREVREGDYVLLDLKSEKESLTRAGFATMVSKEDRKVEFPFVGFARQLLGMKAGDSKTVSHEFPKDETDETLAGQTIGMEATVKTVRSMTLPDLNDDFAKMVGQYENLDALKEALTKDIEARARAEYDEAYYGQVVDKIKEGATLKYASQTLNHEAEHVVEDLGQRLGQQKLDLETYYKMRGTSAEKFFEDEAKPVAKKRLERSLILDEISRHEKIEVDNQALDEEFNNTLVDLQMQGVNMNKIRGGKQGQQRVAEAVAMESASRLLTRRTLERLKAIATGEYKADQQADEAGAKPVKKETPKTSEKKETKSASKSAGKTTKLGASKKTGTKPSAKKSTRRK